MAWFTQLGLESGTTGLQFVGSKVPNVVVVGSSEIFPAAEGLTFEFRCRPGFLMVDGGFV